MSGAYYNLGALLRARVVLPIDKTLGEHVHARVAYKAFFAVNDRPFEPFHRNTVEVAAAMRSVSSDEIRRRISENDAVSNVLRGVRSAQAPMQGLLHSLIRKVWRDVGDSAHKAVQGSYVFDIVQGGAYRAVDTPITTRVGYPVTLELEDVVDHATALLARSAVARAVGAVVQGVR